MPFAIASTWKFELQHYAGGGNVFSHSLRFGPEWTRHLQVHNGQTASHCMSVVSQDSHPFASWHIANSSRKQLYGDAETTYTMWTTDAIQTAPHQQ
jgi:hypothetical protein